jgi:hypothetical protein
VVVTGQQRMLTPPWHLILPSHLSEVRDGPTLDFVIALWIMIYVSHIVNFAIFVLDLCVSFFTANVNAFDATQDSFISQDCAVLNFTSFIDIGNNCICFCSEYSGTCC